MEISKTEAETLLFALAVAIEKETRAFVLLSLAPWFLPFSCFGPKIPLR